MRYLSIIFLCAASVSTARAELIGFNVGASMNAFKPESGRAYGGRLSEISANLDGAVRPWDHDPNFGVHVGLRLNKGLELQLRHRQWSHGMEADFGPASALDFTYRRRIMPTHALVRLLLDGEYMGLRIGGGPGIYQVETRSTGRLGERSTTHTVYGAVVDIALAVRIPGTGAIEFGATFDDFSLPHSDPLIGDAGAAGGRQAYVALTVNL